jgi:nucleoside phosphorylase
MKLVFNPEVKEADIDLLLALRHDTGEGELTLEDRGKNAGAMLARVAEYIRRGEPIPSAFAGTLVTAFEAVAAATSPADREKAITRGLGITQDNKRQKQHPALVRGQVQARLSEGLSETAAIAAAAKAMNMGSTTVRGYWNAYKAEKEALLAEARRANDAADRGK